MLHIVTEDSGSGLIFWKALNESILENRAHVMDENSKYGFGIRTVSIRVKEAIIDGSIISGDSILVAIDNTASPVVIDIIEDLLGMAREYNLHLIPTTYYCIEEMFLSFKELPKWIGDTSRGVQMRKLVEHIRKSVLINDREYFSKLYWDPECEFRKEVDLILRRCSEINREKFTFQLMVYLCEQRKGFKYNKSELGGCWCKGCESLGNIGLDCYRCYLNSTRPELYEKMSSILNNSILGKGSIKEEDLLELL